MVNNIFILLPGTTMSLDERCLNRMLKRIESLGFNISYNIDNKEVNALSEEENNRLHKRGFSFYKAMDCMVLDISDPDTNVHYSIYQAVVYKIPVLCIYKQLTQQKKILKYIRQNNVEDQFRMTSYSNQTLERLIHSFIQENKKKIHQREKEMDITLKIPNSILAQIEFICEKEEKNEIDLLSSIVREFFNRGAN